MKKIYAPKPNTPVVPQHRSFRRFVRKMFASFLKHQDPEVIQRLQELEYKIEIMSRVMARQARRGK